MLKSRGGQVDCLPSPNAGMARWAGALLLAVVTALAYSPSLRGGFLIDDNILLTNSDMIEASNGLYRFWFTTEAPDYWPLTSTTLWLEWRLWGMNPTGYRVTNLVLHILESLLLWHVLNKLKIPGAYLAAFLFAVHPVNVQTVAWIAQRKNLMAMLFYLPAILWYVKFDETTQGRWKWYGLSLLACAAAMLGKGSVATLPLVLLLVVWMRRPLRQRDLLEIAPFFMVCGTFTLVNLYLRTHGHEAAVRDLGFLERLLRASAVVWFYLYKALVPIDLLFIYRKWKIDANDIFWWLPLAAAGAVSAILWRYRLSKGRAFLIAWLFFCMALLPVMGFARVGFMNYSYVSDHYQHIAIIGVIALAAVGWNQLQRRAQLPARILALIVLVTFAWLTFQKNRLYGDVERLYARTLAANPDVPIIQNDYGNILLNRGEQAKALEHYERALALGPILPEYHFNRGVALAQLGRPGEAAMEYGKALAINPDYAMAHDRLGLAIIQQGGPESLAIDHFKRAVRLKPELVSAMNNLAWLYATASNPRDRNINEAVELAKRAADLTKWKDPSILDTLAAAYAQAGLASDAVFAARKAIDIARSSGQEHLVSEIETHLRRYETMSSASKPAN